MGANTSKPRECVEDFHSFSTAISNEIEDLTTFLMNTPRAIPAQKRKTMVLQVDMRLSFIANLATRLHELDEHYEDCINVVIMFDNILSVLWNTLEKRHPDIVNDAKRTIPKPEFIVSGWPRRLGNALLKLVVLVIEIICQCSSRILESSIDDIAEIRNDGPTSVLTVTMTHIASIEENLETTAIQNLAKSDQTYYNSITILIAHARKIVDRLKHVDTMAVRLNTHGIAAKKPGKNGPTHGILHVRRNSDAAKSAKAGRSISFAGDRSTSASPLATPTLTHAHSSNGLETIKDDPNEEDKASGRPPLGDES